MSAVPAGVDPDRGPPLSVPLYHFVVGLAFLLGGLAVTGLAAVGLGPAGLGARLAVVHLLLVGWVCVTILGAMAQFVPVWSGVALHSRGQALAALGLTAVGTAGLAAAFAAEHWGLLVYPGAVLAAGLWTFVYNLGRTLPRGDPDATERLFGVALVAFAVLPTLGLLLAADHAWGLFPLASVDAAGVLGAHATVAVFGAVLATVAGALAQLAPMFTQAPDHRVATVLGRLTDATLVAGLVLAAAGRLVGQATVARVGGLLLAAALLALAGTLAWHLLTATVDWSPMLRRYAVATVAFAAWGVVAGATWLRAPLDRSALLGGGPLGPLLPALAVGFVVVGTLYHVLPFLVWVERYSDALGFRDVPLVDDLYDGRVAALDALLAVLGGTLLVVGESAGVAIATRLGLAAVTLAALLVAGNLLGVVYRHGRGEPRGPDASATD